MRRIATVVMAAAALGGCAVGPDYRRPTPAPATIGPFTTENPAAEPAAPLPPRWWSLYADPALDALVEEALAHNSDLRVAAANLERAQGVLSQARGVLFPSTQITAGVNRARGVVAQNGGGAGGGGAGGGVNVGTDTRTIYRGGVQLSYEVDLFGRVRRTLEAARADVAAAEATRDATRVTVAAAVTQAYFDVCLLAVRVDVQRESTALVEESFDLTRRQVSLGAGSDFELSRVGVLVQQTRAQAEQLEGLRNQALADLTVLLGRPASQAPEAARTCRAEPRLTRPIPVGDGAALLARRPDVRAAERTLAADTARIGVATADLFPTISLGGSVNAIGTSLSNATSRQGVSFGIGPLINWFFPNIIAARGRIEQAGAQARASLAQFDGTVLTALGEVERSLAGYDAEIKRNAALAEAVRNSERAYELTGVRLRYGAISQLEQIDVQRDVISARAALAESDAALGQAQVTLFRALGGGWQEAPAIDERPRALNAVVPGR
ncbi:efflux transporter outer membrane subunit [Sphingomonas sp.]|uniref:efflux transporter outer membrane subunit n=1 Tax=Sphingomonas sp. TaxID=28214 RepID=UPI003B3B6B3E